MKVFKSIDKLGRILIALSIALIVVQVWLDLKMPDYMQEITLLVTSPGGKISDVLKSGGKMLLCCLGSLAASIAVAISASKISSDFGANLRERVYDKVQSFSAAEINRFSTAGLITRSTNDITQVQMLTVMGLQAAVKAPIMAVWGVIKISGKSWQWTLSTGICIAVLICMAAICLLIVMPKFKRLQSLTDDLNRVTRENLTGIRVVRAYNAEEYQENKFDKTNRDLTGTHLFTARALSFMMPMCQLVLHFSALSIYWIGAYLIYNAAAMDKLLIFSEMSVFSSYAMQIIISFMLLVVIFMILPRASVSIKRINEVLDTELSITDGNNDYTITEKQGEVEFKNVCFRYPNSENDVIQDISFSAHKGETVAIIGSTGCGKSTVVNLIPRFFDATKGQVLVDGIDVREYTQKSLRNKIGYISQKAVLFSGTVKSNIQYGENGNGISESDVISSLETAQAADFVENMHDGINSHVAQGGTNFSGGQKQRLSIARAIARDAEILIFDDSFSALDYATDRKLRSVLESKCKAATKIIVAQRIGTIRDADRIVVLDEGRIVGIGTHKELMDSCEVYRQIAYSQLSKEEAI